MVRAVPGPGAATITIRNTGGTDHQSFDAVGLPGFQFIQDPMEYNSRTHHSNMDVYDRIQKGDLMQMAAIVASFVYETPRCARKCCRANRCPNRAREKRAGTSACSDERRRTQRASCLRSSLKNYGRTRPEKSGTVPSGGLRIPGTCEFVCAAGGLSPDFSLKRYTTNFRDGTLMHGPISLIRDMLAAQIDRRHQPGGWIKQRRLHIAHKRLPAIYG